MLFTFSLIICYIFTVVVFDDYSYLVRTCRFLVGPMSDRVHLYSVGIIIGFKRVAMQADRR